MVYEPQEDSYLMEAEVKKYAQGRVLDIGTGKGIQAVAAAEKKEVTEVVAIDSDQESMQYCKENIQNPKITFIQSDLFSNIQETFDTIIFNPPYLPQDTGREDIAVYGGKKGWEIVARFLKDASNHLSSNGIMLLLFSSLTNKGKVEELLTNNLFSFEQVAHTHQFFEDLFVYKITKTDFLKQLEEKEIKNIHYFAKGKRGIIYEGIYQNKPVIIKTKHPESKAAGKIENEVKWLTKLSAKGVGSKPLRGEKTFFVREKVEGPFIIDYIETATKAQAIAVIHNLLDQCFTMDKLGIGKEEMHRPLKHIIVQEHKPIMIDFERCHETAKPHNVTQFCQFLSREDVLRMLKKKGMVIKKETLMQAAKEYSEEKEIGKVKRLFY